MPIIDDLSVTVPKQSSIKTLETVVLPDEAIYITPWPAPMFLNTQLLILVSAFVTLILRAALVLSVLFKSQKVRFLIFHFTLFSQIQIP